MGMPHVSRDACLCITGSSQEECSHDLQLTLLALLWVQVSVASCIAASSNVSLESNQGQQEVFSGKQILRKPG